MASAVIFAKSDEPIEMRTMGSLVWAQGSVFQMGVTLALSSEFCRSICATAAMRAVATIAAATSLIF